MVVNITSTFDRAKYPKGSATIPRASVSTLSVERGRGAWGRGIGTYVGVISGLTLGGYAGAQTKTVSAAIPVFLGITVGTSVLGYKVGRELDKKQTLIKVVP